MILTLSSPSKFTVTIRVQGGGWHFGIDLVYIVIKNQKVKMVTTNVKTNA
jgi:hypothetical protein